MLGRGVWKGDQLEPLGESEEGGVGVTLKDGEAFRGWGSRGEGKHLRGWNNWNRCGQKEMTLGLSLEAWLGAFEKMQVRRSGGMAQSTEVLT